MEKFSVNTQIFSGDQVLQQISRFPISRAYIVSDPFMVKTGAVERVTAVLSEMGAVWEIFDQVAPDPTVQLVAQGVEQVLHFQPDSVLAVGGGSAIDTAKAISFIYTRTSGKSKPFFIAVPTTSGTGSEVTSFAVLAEPDTGRKFPLLDPLLLPDAALLDYNFTLSVPPQVTAETGLDVLTHALEAYVSLQATDFTDALAEKAFVLVLDNLVPAVKNGGDINARQRLHNASCLAGMAFENAGLGLCHSCAHALGGALHLSHGRCNALLLPAVIAFNSGLDEPGDYPARRRYAALARLAGCCCYNEEIAVRSLLKLVERLREQVNIGPCLPEKAQRDEVQKVLNKLSSAALADHCTVSNPRPATAEQLKAFFKAL